jgi:5-methylcytosine-specific restriction enzyme subunit McrC
VIEIRLTEGEGLGEPYALTPGQYAAVHEAKVAYSEPTGDGQWRFRTRQPAPLVGAVRLRRGDDSVLVRIKPKIDIARLMFLVEYARQGKSADWKDEEVTAREEDGVVGAVAWAFGRAAQRALRPGVLTGYREVEAAELLVRGKIRIADQVRRRHTLALPVELIYDDLTMDIPENRLLLSAASELRRLPDLQPKIDDPLREVQERLAEVTPIGRDEPMPRWAPTRLNFRYHRALGLAELVLGGQSYELDEGHGVRTDGLLIDIARLYEDFVTVALQRSLEGRYGGECRINKKHHLDRAGLIDMRPDLVYRQASGGVAAPVAVADAKYIVSPGAEGVLDNLYQVVAYCAALDVRRGFLVYADGPEPGPAPHSIGGRIEVVVYHLDLTQPPPVLRQQIDDLADAMASPVRVTGALLSRSARWSLPRPAARRLVPCPRTVGEWPRPPALTALLLGGAHPVQAPLPIWPGEPADKIDPRRASRAPGRPCELIGALVVKDPACKGGALEQSHDLVSSARHVGEDVHAADEGQIVVDHDDLLMLLPQIHSLRYLVGELGMPGLQTLSYLIAREDDRVNGYSAVLGAAQVREQLFRAATNPRAPQPNAL